MLHAERALFDVLRSQAGAFHRRQALAAVSSTTVARRLGDGDWVRLARDVFAHPAFPDTFERRLWAAWLEAGPVAAACRGTAARLLGFGAYQGHDRIDIVKHERHDHDVSLCRLQRTCWLPPDHVTIVDGLPCTTVARTIFDLAGDPPSHLRRSEEGRAVHADRIRAVVNRAMSHHGLRHAELVAVHAALRKRGRPGTRIITELIEALGPDHQPTESDLEDAFLALLRRHGLPEPDPQVRLGGDRFIGRVDFVYRAHRLVVEIDSRWHDGPDDRESDRARDNELMAIGMRVLRFRWRDFSSRPEWVVRLLRVALNLDSSDPRDPDPVLGDHTFDQTMR